MKTMEASGKRSLSPALNGTMLSGWRRFSLFIFFLFLEMCQLFPKAFFVLVNVA